MNDIFDREDCIYRVGNFHVTHSSRKGFAVRRGKRRIEAALSTLPSEELRRYDLAVEICKTLAVNDAIHEIRHG